MKYLTILAYATSLVAAVHFEQRSAVGNIWHRPSLYSRSFALQRRADQPRGANSRSPSPINRSKVTAKGPAEIYTEAPHGQNRRVEVVRHGETRMMRNAHEESTTAIALTPDNLHPSYAQPLKAEAKGRTVVGLAMPRPGGTGRVRVEDGRTVDESHFDGGEMPAMAGMKSDRPGAAKVTASTNGGGSVMVSGTSQTEPHVYG